MKKYIVTKIEEGFYGCEEASPKVLLTLQGEGEEKKLECEEEWLDTTGIDEGKKVVLGDKNILPVVEVVAALILNVDREVFATERGYGAYKGMWEFPGGKREEGESSEEALIREIKEELDVDIAVGEKIYTLEYDYTDFHLSMDCFFADIREGKLLLKEHTACKWLNKNTLYTVDWLPADRELIKVLEEKL